MRSRSRSPSSTRWRANRSISPACRFLSFIANKKANGDPAAYSFVLRGYVRHWLGNVWTEYDRIKLTDLVAARTQADPLPRAQARA